MHTWLVTAESMTCTKMCVLQSINEIFGRSAVCMCMVSTHVHNYLFRVLELSCAVCYNLIGVWKFLNPEMPDVHDFPDPLSLLE